MRNFVNLPPSQKKIIASLNLENDLPALKLQKKIVSDLFKLYSTGQDSENFTAPVSDAKALTYQKKFIAINDKIKQLEPNQAEQATDNKIINYNDYKLKSSVSDWIFKKMSWFHAIRLFSVRGKNLGEKIYNFITNDLPNYLSPGLKQGISWLGALYGINLIVDIYTLANIVFRARRAGEPDLPYWQRLKDAMTKERCSRMFNDTLWTITNTLGIVLTGGTNILLTVGIITVGSFFLDVVNETTTAGLGWRNHKLLLKTGENSQADDELPQNSIDHINKLVKEKSKDARFSTFRAAFVFSFVAFASIPGALPLFNFIKQPIISLISSTISFVVGSLAAGFGRKIYLKYKEHQVNKTKKNKEDQKQTGANKTTIADGNPPPAPALALANQVEPAAEPVLADSVAAASPELPRSKTLFTEAHLIKSMSKDKSRPVSQIAALDLAMPSTRFSDSQTLTRNPSNLVFPNFTFPTGSLPRVNPSSENKTSTDQFDHEKTLADQDDNLITTADVSIEPTDSSDTKHTQMLYGSLWHTITLDKISSIASTPLEEASPIAIATPA